MKVLLINGSPRREGNTFIALSEAARALEAEGVGAEIVSIGTKAVQGCIACGKCAELGRCVFNDALYNEVREKLAGADALVVGSPVYYAGPNGSLCALLDRLFYSCSDRLAYKPAASISRFQTCPSCRRNTGTASTGGCRARRRRTPKGCRRCACWPATWRGCSGPDCWLRKAVPNRKSGS